MSMEKKVPEIRFKGFNGDWQSLNLDQITDVYDGTHQTPTYTKNGVMFLSAENIKTLTSHKFITKKAFMEEFKIFPQKNDVLMTRIGDVGTANVVETDDCKAYYVTLALLKYKQLSPYFLKNSIASPYVQRDIWLRTLHIAFPKKINMNEIKQVIVSFPSDQKESNEIGNTFQKLDNLINQHQQKHDKLSNIKKAMLEKMFPKQGETIPEIGFKGFSGEWKSLSLDEIADVLDGDRGHNYPNGEDLKEEGHTLFLSASNVTKNGFKFDTRQYITQEKSECLGNGKLVIDDIVLTSRGSIGHIAWYNENVTKEISFARINSGMLILRAKNYIAPNVICQYLKSPKGKKKIEIISFGSAQPQLTKASVSKFLVSIPVEEKEQTAIGNFFQKLDNLINQHQQQITKLNHIKQACLRKMFV